MPPPPKPKASSEKYIRSVSNKIKRGEITLANCLLKEALVYYPKNIELLKLSSDICRLNGNIKNSLSLSETILREHPDNYDGYLRAALDRLSLGEDEICKVQQLCKQTHGQIPKNLEMFRNFACRKDKKTRAWLESFSIKNTHFIYESNQLPDWQPIQYWSQGAENMPEDVKNLTSLWNQLFKSLKINPIKVFDKISGRRFIIEKSPGLIKAFDSSFHFAVEADIFRIAFAIHNDCIWLDSDLYPTIHTENILSRFLQSNKTILYYRWFRPHITNAFFMSPKKSSFFAEIERQTNNYDFDGKSHTSDEIMHSFGPGRYNKVLDMFFDSTIENFSLEDLIFINEHNALKMTPPFDLKYKSTSSAWQNNFPS